MQARKKHFLDDLTHPAFIKDKVTVMDTKKNCEVITATNLAFTRDSKSNTKYLMVEI